MFMRFMLMKMFMGFQGVVVLVIVAVVFVVTVAAAEVGLALAIVLRLFRNRKTVNVDEVDLMKW